MGSDVAPDRFQPMRSVYFLDVNSIEGADHIYALLAEGGNVFMPMQEALRAFSLACSGTNSAHRG